MTIFGNLALERFTFMTPDKDLQIVLNITFGYALRISEDNMAGIYGIVGLQATNPSALVSLFGRKFSYCLGNIRDTEYSVLFDSGSSISHLKESGYESIVEEVDNLMTRFDIDSVYIGDGEECYQGNMDQDLDGFPLLTFHFSQGADFEVGVEGMFLPFNRSIFCLAIHKSESESESNIIGVLAQQFYNVGFDFDANRIYFQNVDCDALEG
ncbi:aspartyl protease UND-like [Primulina eburnea]|uniref:aspartyl protease UND-like n=1 Tax=Primulina eburnea TaxID=1245227 RepID=UPI003C6C7505